MLASGEITVQEWSLIFIRIRSSQQLKDFEQLKTVTKFSNCFNLPKFDTSCVKITLLHFMKFNT